jgi:serine/threonine protein kinase
MRGGIQVVGMSTLALHGGPRRGGCAARAATRCCVDQDDDPAVSVPSKGRWRSARHQVMLATTPRSSNVMANKTPTEVKCNVIIHEWKVGRSLGGGGQGDVWEVRPTTTPHAPPRAMKICTATDPVARQRFEREVATLSRLDHPGIVPLYDSNTDWQAAPATEIICAYYVTERYPGALASVSWWKEAPVYCLSVFRQICDAIEYLHSREPPILHRDLKPQNILFDPGSERSAVAVTDLGTVTGPKHETPLTQHHEVIGTPYYRAPECQYGQYDERSDVFSLGRILAWMLTGTTPDRPSPPLIPDTSPLSQTARESLNLLIARACAPEPDDRYGNVAQFKDALPSLIGAIAPQARQPAASQRESATQIYQEVKDILRRGDTMGWQDLKKVQRAQIQQVLAGWRKEVEASGPSHATLEQCQEWLDDALTALKGPLAFTLASLEAPPGSISEDDVFRLISDILHNPSWGGGGLSLVVEDAPISLVSATHNLLGASLAMTNRIESIVRLAHLKIAPPQRGATELWRSMPLLSYMPFLGGKAVVSWDYLRTLPDRHPWLKDIYSSSLDYQIYLCAYWWVMSTIELAAKTSAQANEFEKIKPADFQAQVLPLMLLKSRDIQQRSFQQLLGTSHGLKRITDEMGITEGQVRRAWPYWKEVLTEYACGRFPSPGSFVFRDQINIPDFP